MSVLVGLFIWLGGLGFRKVLVALVGVVGGGAYGFFTPERNVMLILVCVAVTVVIALIFERIFITIMAIVLAVALSFGVLSEVCVEEMGDLEHAFSQMPIYSWVIMSALVVFFIAAGFFFRRLTSALCYATLGTILVFAGMILLLSYKGSGPVNYIRRNPSFYIIVFAAMAGFGTIEQLLLFKFAKKKLAEKKQADKPAEKSEKKPSSWRTT
ncbi:MAG: hypothetical protein ACYS1A_07315 [Planctomycetota bacterium]